MMDQTYQKLQQCYESLRSKINFNPEVALILGSGLGDYAEQIDIRSEISYKDIKGFPVSTVSGHKGRFVFGYVGKVPVVIMQGRVHYYEGYPMSDVVLPTRLMGLMGARKLILTNAAGGINEDFEGGNLMIIKDHISNFVPNPLIGPNVEIMGTRFPDMSEIYDKEFRKIIKESEEELGIPVKEGVYIQLTGPSYESPAEIRMCRALGADAVGMSTACEAIAARHMGLRVCGISCITNMAAGILDQPLNHEEVKQTADRVSSQFRALVTKVIERI